MLLPLFRYCQALALLLLLGACQRATYSFQAPGALAAAASAAPPAVVAPLPTEEPLAAAPVTLAAPTRHAARPPRRHRAAAPAKMAAVTERPGLLQTLRAVRAAHRVVARQQPLPTGEPVRYRSRGIALLLALVPLLFGLPLGLHYYYLGYTGRGILTLAVGLVALILIVLGLPGLLVAFFGFSSGALALFLIGAILLSILSLLQLIDAVRIILGDLRPKNGEYYPRFFQTR